MMMMLLVLGCAEGEPVEFDEGVFIEEYAEAACDQLYTCDPDSWLALEGKASCIIEQRYQARGWVPADPCGRLVLDQAEICLADMALLPCHQSIISNELPESCWSMQSWEDCELFEPEDLPRGF